MRRSSDEFSDAPGNDSFLDIVANMVGIMILLVMVVGLRVSHTSATPPTAIQMADEPIEPAVSQDELSAAIRTAVVAKKEAQELAERAVAARYDAALREKERNLMVEYVAAFQEELDARRAKLSEQQQRDVESRIKIAKAKELLDQLTVQQVGLLSQSEEVDVIEHQPTPVTRKLNGKEVHLLLSNGHVAMVPVTALMDAFQQDYRRNLWRLKEEDHFAATVGPIDQFRLRYYVRKREIAANGALGSVQKLSVPRLDKFKILPIDRRVGEPVQQAILPGSELRKQLDEFQTHSTAVAISFHADSISDLHLLKGELREIGYSVAELMLPNGQPMGFSPQGSEVRVQ